MNILFLTLVYPEGENSSNIYIDLMKELKSRKNDIYVATALERRNNKKTTLNREQGINVLRIKTGNIQKTNVIEKGFSTLLLEYQFINAIKKNFNKIKFDLIIYSTPPITFEKVINMIKNRDKAKNYLLLKDIFPQNAVDMNMVRENSILYNFFKRKEKKLYEVSDYIGCMSEKNKSYLLEQNNYIENSKIEVCPNSIKIKELGILKYENRVKLKDKLGIPRDAIVIIYGGNLGKPQGIDFLIDIIDFNKYRDDVFFLIIGNGTEYSKLESFINDIRPKNAKLYPYIPKKQYDEYVKCSDIGLILLDRRFTIPNFPSRILGYMEYGLPILAATDINTDIGEYISKGNLGYWCESGDINRFNINLDKLVKDKELREEQGINSRKYLEENYSVELSADIIMKHFL